MQAGEANDSLRVEKCLLYPKLHIFSHDCAHVVNIKRKCEARYERQNVTVTQILWEIFNPFLCRATEVRKNKFPFLQKICVHMWCLKSYKQSFEEDGKKAMIMKQNRSHLQRLFLDDATNLGSQLHQVEKEEKKRYQN